MYFLSTTTAHSTASFILQEEITAEFLNAIICDLSAKLHFASISIHFSEFPMKAGLSITKNTVGFLSFLLHGRVEISYYSRILA